MLPLDLQLLPLQLTHMEMEYYPVHRGRPKVHTIHFHVFVGDLCPAAAGPMQFAQTATKAFHIGGSDRVRC